MSKNDAFKLLERILFDAEKNVIDWDQFYKWQEFKEEWPKDDKIYWDSLLKIVYKNNKGNRTLNRALSDEEEAWVINLLKTAVDKSIFRN